MNRKERVLGTLQFEPVDRVPVVGGFVRHPGFLAAAAGVTVKEFWESPRTTAISAFRALGVDVIIGLILPVESTTGGHFEQPKQDKFQSPEDVRDYVYRSPPLRR